jgi:hypothetical protein
LTAVRRAILRVAFFAEVVLAISCLSTNSNQHSTVAAGPATHHSAIREQ